MAETQLAEHAVQQCQGHVNTRIDKMYTSNVLWKGKINVNAWEAVWICDTD